MQGQERFPLRASKENVTGGIFWILTLEFFVGQVIAQVGWRGLPSYSPISDAISNLGVTVCGMVKIGGVSGYYCSPLHDVMNASFILAGVFMLLGLYLTRSSFHSNRSTRAGAVLLAIAGLGKITVGLNPANVDFTLHFLGALGIPVAGVGMIFSGRGFRGKVGWLANLSEILGVIGLIGFILFLFTSRSGIGGLTERIADYPMFVWFATMGFLFLSHASKEEGKGEKRR